MFSLGSVLVLAATGRSPFSAATTLQILYDVVHAEPDLTAVPVGLRGLVERCLAKDPAARPAPAELLALLGPVAPVGRQWPPAVYRNAVPGAGEGDRPRRGRGRPLITLRWGPDGRASPRRGQCQTWYGPSFSACRWTLEPLASRKRPVALFFSFQALPVQFHVDVVFVAGQALSAVATRYDKRAHVFYGTVTVASIRLWLRS
ncbi:hypothetical protein [Streptomyces sp. NBC_01276]|uniref:hypothetical protein n=1 Tax=Streptomyces sp. NBC_01276 TaxID=2903808 RepID=UPI00352F9248